MDDEKKPFDPKTDPVDELVVAKLEAFAEASRVDLEQQLEKYKDRNRAAPDIAAVLERYQKRWADDTVRASMARAKLEKQRRERTEAQNAELLVANKEMAAASREAARYSAESATASKRSAFWTFVAALAAAVALAIQGWQAAHREPQPAPAPPPAPRTAAPR